MKFEGEEVQPVQPLEPEKPIAEVIPMGETVYAFRFKEPLSPQSRARLNATIEYLDLPFKVIVLGPEVEIFKLTT